MRHSRHTFGRDMVRAGLSLPALMQLMGHAQIRTTMLYVELSPVVLGNPDLIDKVEVDLIASLLAPPCILSPLRFLIGVLP